MAANPDFTWVSGDTQPVYTTTLAYSDQTPVDLTGMSVSLQMRAMNATSPVTITGTLAIVEAGDGVVSYTPSVADGAISGNYIAKIIAVSGSEQMSFPTNGYLWFQVQPSVGTEPQQLVSLMDAKMELNITASDRYVDLKLIRWIEAVRPEIEHICGPILMQTFEEWHPGGQTFLRLRRRPSSAMGTSPVIIPIACSEYLGPIEWPLAIIQSPDQGQLYSCMFNTRLGIVERRTAGGGVQPFASQGEQSVHVVYQAGQATVPANVRAAVIEVVRENYMNTQAVGTGEQTFADAQDNGRPPGFMFSAYARSLLTPTRRHPNLA